MITLLTHILYLQTLFGLKFNYAAAAARAVTEQPDQPAAAGKAVVGVVKAVASVIL